MTDPSREPVVDMLDEVWASFAEACEGLSADDWDRATDCPGWTVRDQLSHVIGIERELLGERPPAGRGDDRPYVKNDFAARNERWVDARRSRPGPEVLEELREVTARRLEVLASMPAAAYDEIGWSPVGQVPYREFMEIRVLDSWVHEQDVRRAVGRPGGLGGAGEAVTIDRMAAAMGYVVGRKVAPPEGTAVVWRITGRFGREVAVLMEGGRGTVRASAPAAPAVVLTLGPDAFRRLSCGRTTANEALAAGDVELGGDVTLGRRVLDAMAVTT